MGKYEKVLFQVLRGVSDQNISFKDLCGLLDHLGFNKRIKGSHHIYFREDIEEIINLQPKDSKAKILPGKASTQYDYKIQIGRRRIKNV